MAKTGPQLYQATTRDGAIAALGDATKASPRCAGCFVVLPRAIAWFVTLGVAPAGSSFTRPSVLAWKPGEGAHHGPEDALPRPLLGKVHLFVRTAEAEPFRYVGKTALIPQFRCDFETVAQIAPKLRRDVWEALGGYRGVVVDLDGDRVLVGDAAAIGPVLERIRRAPRADVNTTRYEEDAFHALFAGDRAFLMFLPEIGEAGMSSRDPDYRGPPGAQVVFRATNGEDTALPARFTVSKEEGLRALDAFLRTGKPPTFIHWEDD